MVQECENVVTGYGNEVGAALVEHHDVARITLTGSDSTGATVYEGAARSVKRVSLDLGGLGKHVLNTLAWSLSPVVIRPFE